MKRLFDAVISVVGLIVLTPLLVAVALAIKAESAEVKRRAQAFQRIRSQLLCFVTMPMIGVGARARRFVAIRYRTRQGKNRNHRLHGREHG